MLKEKLYIDEEEFNKKIGCIIARHRSKARMTRVEFSEKIGVSAYQVKKYESGINSVSLYRLYLCAQALDRQLSELIPDVEKRASNES
jgi:transcriptional regulator with XRE-family HTH domain